MLQGKKIVLGVCGGIAVYKAVELLRLYVKAGAEVHVIMTASAQEFVTPLTFQTLSGNPVHTDLFNLYQEKEIGHISLADRADLFVVAPATANVVGKLAAGIADDLLTTTLMATRAPVLFVPSMNVNMYENPIYRQNEEKLQGLGYRFMAPATGFLACGWEGKGKLPEPAAIFTESERMLAPQDLAGETILVTAGPTREEIDPVRFLSNRSSGRMGYAVAAVARRRGARVILVSGPTGLTPPDGVETVPVTSAEQMREAVLAKLPASTVVIKAAAVADYRPAAAAAQKIKKGEAAELLLKLVKNPDILAELGSLKGGRVLVGFAAETADLLANAGRKLREKNLDLIVANDVTEPGAGFDLETNIVRLLHRDGTVEELPQMAKEAVAGAAARSRPGAAQTEAGKLAGEKDEEAGHRVALPRAAGRSGKQLQQAVGLGDPLAEFRLELAEDFLGLLGGEFAVEPEEIQVAADQLGRVQCPFAGGVGLPEDALLHALENAEGGLFGQDQVMVPVLSFQGVSGDAGEGAQHLLVLLQAGKQEDGVEQPLVGIEGKDGVRQHAAHQGVIPLEIFAGDGAGQEPDLRIHPGFAAHFPVGVLEQDGVEGAHHLVGDEEGVCHGIRRQMRKVAVGAGLLGIGHGGLEDLAPHPPGMAVIEIMRELFAESDVGADAAVQEIVRIGFEQALQHWRQGLQAVQYG